MSYLIDFAIAYTAILLLTTAMKLWLYRCDAGRVRGHALDRLASVYGFERGGIGPWWSPFSEMDHELRERTTGAIRYR